VGNVGSKAYAKKAFFKAGKISAVPHVYTI